ncbi:DUF2798 domain-containing protein [Vibrio nitrifigilis]|uniref:DUF2798 domain-containing protein n=1 Tax=Vibrio nitrifigilis TaxID=2789781 RepID=A0ABS0GIM2_9VIBR|nr:DUF2798 domain-containing protein [Vibrio nitrifigilis]MBF9002280.1 DUF2798 domain-containing protein [Vibrio nitrifigilis]
MNLKKVAITLPAPICIVSTLSLFMTYINHGFSDDFLAQWLKALAFSLIIMLPLAGLLIMKIGKFVETRFGHIKPLYQKLIQCAGIAFTLEAILAVISTLSTTHPHDIAQFLTTWSFTLVRALPLGYVIAMIMVFIVKPKIQRALAAAA